MKNLQAKHFDIDNNQHQFVKILNPPPHVQDELNEIIKLIKKFIKDKQVVDFGAGSGRLTIPLLKNGFNVTAVDISSKSLKNLFSNALKINKQKRLTIRKNLPKKSNIICGTDILHHINLTEYLPIFYKCLDKDGMMMIFNKIGWLREINQSSGKFSFIKIFCF